MKINMPVTSVEYALKDSDSLRSKTDLKGMITYVNEGFPRISGFAREEPIGAPHTVERHPDRLTEAFAERWKAVKTIRTGATKNPAQPSLNPSYSLPMMIGRSFK